MAFPDSPPPVLPSPQPTLPHCAFLLGAGEGPPRTGQDVALLPFFTAAIAH